MIDLTTLTVFSGAVLLLLMSPGPNMAFVIAIVAQWPPAFDLIRLSGVFYLVWMAYKALRNPGVLQVQTKTQRSLSSVSVRSMTRTYPVVSQAHYR